REQSRVGFTTEAELIPMTENYRDTIREASVALAEQQRKMADSVATARVMRDVFGFTTEKLIDLAQQAGAGEKDIDLLTRALNSDIDSLKGFAEELSKATNRMFNAELAALRLSVALKEIRAPKISIEGIQGVVGAEEVVDRGVDVLAAQGIRDRRVQARALEGDTRALIDAMKAEAAASARSDAEARRLYNTQKSLLSPATRELVDLTEATAKRMGAFTDGSNKAAAAATKQAAALKALASVTSQLEQEVVRATIAALREDKRQFDERRTLAGLEFATRKNELAANNQLTAENLNRLRTIYIRGLDQITKDEIVFYQKQRREQFEHLRKQREDRIKQVTEMLREEREIRLREDRTTRFVLEQQELQSRERRIGRDTRRDAERDLLDQQARDLERVARAFGFASQNAELYRQQIALLNRELSNQEAIVLGVGLATESFIEDWIRSGATFQAVADGIGDSLRRMVASGEDFGANMKAVFLELIANLAEYWGQFFISLGAGMLFFNPAAGIGLIAAGVALTALAGVLRGLADRSRQAARAQEGAAAGGGAGGAAAGGGGSRSQRPPTIIPFPTSPQSRSGGGTLSVSLDRSGVTDFLEGREVLTPSNIQGRHFDRVKKTVKKMTN
ncbi:MAG: hypothetical protein L0229_20190, partial [Blastocatellia bacterium]|nr:hypothetical protein [Blastocatellia bacterium]